MNMLYRQIASQKAALNREKEQIAEKLEKKRQKHAITKLELADKIKINERLRTENQQLGQFISQWNELLKGKKTSSPEQLAGEF